MATSTPNPTPQETRPRFNSTLVLGIVALFIPVSYVIGRYAAPTVAVMALGGLIGVPVGLFFGSLRRIPAGHPGTGPRGNTRQMERDILAQLRSELAENRALFDARKGSTTMFARIDYITPFWTSIKASGRLFVMQNAQLLNTVATAYYWLEQGTRLERLAYEAKYAAAPEAGTAEAERLISEARLLDGQIDAALSSAISALDTALAS